MLEIDFVYVIFNNYNYAVKSINDLIEKFGGKYLKLNVIIVDNSYSISSKRIISKFNKFCDNNSNKNVYIHYLPSDINLGFSKACNKGFNFCNSETVIFANCDTRFYKTNADSFLKSINLCKYLTPIVGVKILNNKGIMANSAFSFNPLFILLKPLNHLAAMNKLFRFLLDNNFLNLKLNNDYYEKLDNGSVNKVDWISGCFMIVNREFLKEIGGFDERYFMYFDDVDLCRTAKQHNKIVLFDSQTSIIHFGQHESRKYKSILKTFISNKTARYHIFSWIKYLIKWRKDFLNQ